MKWYFSQFHGQKNMEEIMDSYGALLVIQARPIEYGKHHSNNSYKGYDEFSREVKRLSHLPPFKSDAYVGCLVNGSTIKAKPKNCSEYNTVAINVHPL
jgi:hypothetical protein